MKTPKYKKSLSYFSLFSNWQPLIEKFFCSATLWKESGLRQKRTKNEANSLIISRLCANPQYETFGGLSLPQLRVWFRETLFIRYCLLLTHFFAPSYSIGHHPLRLRFLHGWHWLHCSAGKNKESGGEAVEGVVVDGEDSKAEEKHPGRNRALRF